MLERAGYSCQVAENGAIGLEMVQQGDFDLVFMDVSMPVMDGLTATRHIRAMGGKFATLPLIAMTAQSMSGDRERCLGAGMSDYLSKPVDRQAMLQTLQHWLEDGHGTCPATAVAPVNDYLDDAPNDTTIDWQVLQQMATDVGDDAVVRLLNVFELDLKRRIQSFQSALAEEDWPTLERESHTLKSSCASCGLQKLAQHMHVIEAALHTGDTATAKTQASTVDPLVTAAVQGVPVALTPRRLAMTAARHPLMTQRVSALIRVHGIWLWARRLPMYTKAFGGPKAGRSSAAGTRAA